MKGLSTTISIILLLDSLFANEKVSSFRRSTEQEMKLSRIFFFKKKKNPVKVDELILIDEERVINNTF